LDTGFSTQAIPQEFFQRLRFLEHFIAGDRGLDCDD
jgi:hypothetical protein